MNMIAIRLTPQINIQTSFHLQNLIQVHKSV